MLTAKLPPNTTFFLYQRLANSSSQATCQDHLQPQVLAILPFVKLAGKRSRLLVSMCRRVYLEMRRVSQGNAVGTTLKTTLMLPCLVQPVDGPIGTLF